MPAFQPQVLWMTGLSGAGKSTIAYALEKKLQQENVLCEVLDGDMLRNGINAGLGFTESDRKENIRRAAEIAKILCENNFVVICSLITPVNELRKLAADIIGDKFRLIHISTSLEECQSRDVKGLYQKAMKGEIPNFTGVSAPFDPPVHPDFELKGIGQSIEESVEKLYTFLRNSGKQLNA
jgi:adenylylsulfate kinase